MKKLITLFVLFFIMTFYSANCQEKTVYDIKMRGAKKTKVDFIKKVLETKNGGVLDSLILDRDIIKLKRLPGISHASYQVFIAENDLYDVFFNVEENFTIIPDLSFWSTLNRKFAYRIGVTDYNFLGRGVVIGGFYQNNGFDSYAFNIAAPYLFSRKFGLAVNFQNWTSEEPLYFGDDVANYKYNNVSTEVLALYEINFSHSLQFGINFFTEKYKYLEGFTDPSIPTDLELDKKLLKLIYVYDHLDYFYQFLDGWKNVFYGQYVATENDFQEPYLIFWNDVLYFKRVGSKGNWANRLRFGLSSNSDSPFAPFVVDSNTNLRGVGFLIDRGTGSIVLNTEYRYTLFEKKQFVLQGNAFVDSGTWRNPGGDLSDFVKSENIKVYTGVGLRFMHKRIYNAVFRIDYGYGITKDASQGFVFGVGQYF